MHKDSKKVAIIGFGAMARSLDRSLRAASSEVEIAAALIPPGLEVEQDHVQFFHNVKDLVEWGPSVVVECASHEAVKQSVPELLRAGIDVIVVSIGSLGDADLLRDLRKAAEDGGSKLTVASGAIGGLDVLRSAKIAGLDSVVYTGVKPPAAWKDTPAERHFDLPALSERTVIFEAPKPPPSIPKTQT